VNGALTELSDLTHACERFLYAEAALLDHRKLRDWLALMSAELRYEMPLRVVRIGGLDEHTGTGFYFNETYDTLATRIKRFESEFAWAEDPPSRTRRCISNVFVEDTTAHEVRVRSNIVLFRYRVHKSEPDIISAERVDRLQRDGATFKLLHRTIYIDSAVPATHNFALFF
jgi:3-phenylpropionate/cinnamic acid dioxygenase small subunit